MLTRLVTCTVIIINSLASGHGSFHSLSSFSPLRRRHLLYKTIFNVSGQVVRYSRWYEPPPPPQLCASAHLAVP